MKTATRFSVMLMLSVSMASVAITQNSDVAHNTWSSGKPMPIAAMGGTAVVLGNRIILLGGVIDWSGGVANTLVYNPASNAWSKGASLPMPTIGSAAAVVNNVLYVFGGLIDNGITFTNAVWAYDPQTKTWSSKSPMPTARSDSGAVLEKNNIYVIGGRNPARLDTVESYNPATDTWTQEAPLRIGQSNLTVGRVGTWIVATDGYAEFGDTGDIEGLNPLTNAWQRGTPDPTLRDGTCGGSIGSQLYVAGGYGYGPPVTLTESFSPNNVWEMLADMPQATIFSFSAVYNGQLYCFGGAIGWTDTLVNTVQIYQP